jgi:peptidoglycan L-alanyl-D-glutamate endopeptidase CwlK
MADQVTLNRIQQLHPSLRAEAQHIYLAQIVPALTGRAICRFSYTIRTFEEQNILYSYGRTKLYDAKGNKLGVVTNAKGGQSLHNYGLALDIALIKDTNGDGTYETSSWEDTVDFDKDGTADWMEIVKIFKRSGWEWGGDWKFKDRPHFQKTFGHSWKTLLAKYKASQFIPGTNYVMI